MPQRNRALVMRRRRQGGDVVPGTQKHFGEPRPPSLGNTVFRVPVLGQHEDLQSEPPSPCNKFKCFQAWG